MVIPIQRNGTDPSITAKQARPHSLSLSLRRCSASLVEVSLIVTSSVVPFSIGLSAQTYGSGREPLNPVLAKTTVPLGEFAPTLPFEKFLTIQDYVAYTPLINAVGAPAMSVPLGMSATGLPIGAHFAAKAGDEKTLLELAYQLEQAKPWFGLHPPVRA